MKPTGILPLAQAALHYLFLPSHPRRAAPQCDAFQGPELFLALALLAEHAQLGGFVPGLGVVLQLIDPPVTVTVNDVVVHRVCHDAPLSAAAVILGKLHGSYLPRYTDYARNVP
jgi:hypothetical protein